LGGASSEGGGEITGGGREISHITEMRGNDADTDREAKLENDPTGGGASW